MMAGGGVTPPTPSRLPDGYTEVEYIENTSTARINTGISGVSEWELLAILVTEGNATPVLFGRNASGGHFFGSIPAVDYQWGMGSTAGTYVSTSALVKTTISLRVTSNKIIAGTINGETFTRTASANSTNAFYLFNSSVNGEYPFKGRIYGDVVCRKNGNEVFRGVPCISPTNEVGLYDLINNTFKGSSNTATFVAGPVI